MPNPEHSAAPEGAEDKLQQAFEQTREFTLWREFATALQDGAHETAPTVAIPTRFLRLAIEQIRDPNNYPLAFPVLERAFNRLVAELRLPPSFRMPPRPAEDEPTVTDAQENELWERFEASDEYTRWRAFVSALDGIEQGRAPTVEVPTAFLRIAHVGLEPFRFDALRDVWNGLCEKLDLPQHRKES